MTYSQSSEVVSFPSYHFSLTKWMVTVVWYLWAGSLVLAIPNNSGQSDRHLVTCTSKNKCKPQKGRVLRVNSPVYIPRLRSSSVPAEIFDEWLTVAISDNHFPLCTRELQTHPLNILHVILVDTWPCSDPIGQNYLKWQEPRNQPKDTRPPFPRPFC